MNHFQNPASPLALTLYTLVLSLFLKGASDNRRRTAHHQESCYSLIKIDQDD